METVQTPSLSPTAGWRWCHLCSTCAPQTHTFLTAALGQGQPPTQACLLPAALRSGEGGAHTPARQQPQGRPLPHCGTGGGGGRPHPAAPAQTRTSAAAAIFVELHNGCDAAARPLCTPEPAYKNLITNAEENQCQQGTPLDVASQNAAGLSQDALSRLRTSHP